MQLTANPVPDELSHNAEPLFLNVRLNSVRDIGKPAAYLSCLDAQLQRLFSHLQKSGLLSIKLANRQGKGGIPIKAFIDNPEIDTEDVALNQRLVISKTMHHLFIGG